MGETLARTSEKTWWECSEGHRFYATYSNVYRGQNCPVCSAEIRKTGKYSEPVMRTPADFQWIAESRGFKWLGPEVRGVKTKTTFECPKGHLWEATYVQMRVGVGCPYCFDMVNGVKVSKPQRAISEMLGGALNIPVGKYSLDIAISRNDIAIGIEYDGWYWHKDQLDTDRERIQSIMDDGWRIVHVKSDAMTPTAEQLEAAIARIIGGEVYVEVILDDWKA